MGLLPYSKYSKKKLAFRMIRLLVGMCGAETETLAVAHEFSNFTGTSKGSKTFCIVLLYKLFIFSYILGIFGVQEVWQMFRLLQTVLFKTDSVFNALFCSF